MVIASSHPHHHNQHQQQHPATKTHGIESMEMDHQVINIDLAQVKKLIF